MVIHMLLADARNGEMDGFVPTIKTEFIFIIQLYFYTFTVLYLLSNKYSITNLQ